MDYSEVSSAFCKLVETHFLQRCPPVAGAEKTGSAAATTPAAQASTPLPTPESFADCYRVPQVTLRGQGKRRLSSEDGEDQRNAKKAKMDSEVDLCFIVKVSYKTLKYKYLNVFRFLLDARRWGDLLAGEFREVPSPLQRPGRHQCCRQ